MAITVITTEGGEDKAAKVEEATRSLECASVEIETVKSYYWWDGKVQFDTEWRLAIVTSSPFDTAQSAITKVHSYTTPMIIYDLPDASDSYLYWKGVVHCKDEAAAMALGQELVSERIIACGQVTASGILTMKTIAAGKEMVKKKLQSSSGPTASWTAIGGNQEYLDWMEKECVATKS